MSTILKALKKAESDSKRPKNRTEEGGVYQPSDSGADLAADLGTQRDSEDPRARSWWRFGYVISILVLLIGVGIWLSLNPVDSHLKNQSGQTVPAAKKTMDQAASPAGTQGKADAGPRLGRNALPTQPPAAMDIGRQIDPHETAGKVASTGMKSKPAVQTESRGPEFSSSQGLSKTNRQKKRLPDPIGKKPNDMAKAGPINKQASGDQKKKGSSDEPRWRDAQRLKDDRIVLQAVSWAPRREKRIGMIDGQIVREGDDTNGYTVVAIRKRSLILQRDGKYFRLEFQRR